MPPQEHDLETCPLATEISACNRERGEIITTLKAINETLADLKPLIQAHQDWIQRSTGAMTLVGILCTIAGGIIVTLFTWLTKGH